MALRDKIDEVIRDGGGSPLAASVKDALVELIKKECALKVHEAMMAKSVGKLLKEFAAFLDEKGYEIDDPERVRQDTSESYRLARQIFKNRNILVPFMCKVAVEVSGGKPIMYVVDSVEDANVLRNFLKGLTETGHTLECSEDGRTFVVKIPSEKTKHLFFRSGWAEECFRYVISKVVSAASKDFDLTYKIIPNVKIRKKGASTLFTEFDVVVQLGDRFYVFEVKSGPWVRIMQWAKREQEFVSEEGPLRVIVCTIHNHIPCEIFKPQILVNLDNFEERVSEIFAKDFGGRAEGENDK